MPLVAVLIPIGSLLFVIGLRIAYNHRGAGDTYLRITRKRLPRWWPRLQPETERTLGGSVIGALGLVLAGLAILSLWR